MNNHYELKATIAEYGMEIGQTNYNVHFSLPPGAGSTLRYDMMRKTNQKESRQNDAPTQKARTIPHRSPKACRWRSAVLSGQHTQSKRTVKY